jgi:hypothetical protein
MKHRTHFHIPSMGTPLAGTGPATAHVVLRCPSCQAETLALAGSLCERCNPDSTPLAPDTLEERRTRGTPPHHKEA